MIYQLWSFMGLSSFYFLFFLPSLTCSLCREAMCSQRQQPFLQFSHVLKLLCPLCQVKDFLEKDLSLRTSGHYLSISGSSIKLISASQKGKARKKVWQARHNSTEVRSGLEMYFKPVENAQRTIIQREKNQPKKKLQPIPTFWPKKEKRWHVKTSEK